jgi:hypothetical protein
MLFCMRASGFNFQVKVIGGEKRERNTFYYVSIADFNLQYILMTARGPEEERHRRLHEEPATPHLPPTNDHTYRRLVTVTNLLYQYQ